MMFELTMAELKTAFRIFDEDGEGFIREGFIIFSPAKVWTDFNLLTLPLPFFKLQKTPKKVSYLPPVRTQFKVWPWKI